MNSNHCMWSDFIISILMFSIESMSLWLLLLCDCPGYKTEFIFKNGPRWQKFGWIFGFHCWYTRTGTVFLKRDGLEIIDWTVYFFLAIKVSELRGRSDTFGRDIKSVHHAVQTLVTASRWYNFTFYYSFVIYLRTLN